MKNNFKNFIEEKELNKKTYDSWITIGKDLTLWNMTLWSNL